MVIFVLQRKKYRANEKLLMIMVMPHKHQVYAPQTRMIMQTHSMTLHMWMIMLKNIHQIFQFLNCILVLYLNWKDSLNV